MKINGIPAATYDVKKIFKKSVKSGLQIMAGMTSVWSKK